MENKQKKEEYIDVCVIMKKLWEKKKLFYKTIPVAFVLSCAWILPQPRYYTSEVTLAPEMESIGGGGALGEIASSFGLNVGGTQSTDAIYPMLYPDLLSSSNFIVALFDVKVTTDDNELSTDYYTYLLNHQKKNIYTAPIRWVKRTIKDMLKDPSKVDKDAKADPFRLSEEQTNIVEMVRNNISVAYDNKTSVISIEVKDQDPLICATLVDSISQRLQSFITEYRTKKARNDFNYYKKLVAEAKADYEKSLVAYSSYSDSHANAIWAETQVKKDNLSRDYQQKYNTYNMLYGQMEAAMAKVQDCTPVFAVIQGASVPVKPAGPKRMLFVLAMMILAGFGTASYIIYKDRANLIFTV